MINEFFIIDDVILTSSNRLFKKGERTILELFENKSYSSTGDCHPWPSLSSINIYMYTH